MNCAAQNSKREQGGSPFKPDIIFEDQWIIALNKPPGLLTVPTPKNEPHTLSNLLNNWLSKRSPVEKAHPCHRLDRDTSGIILFAKSGDAQNGLEEQFRARKIEKKYIAFVRGVPKKESGEIKSFVKADLKKEPKLAITKYRVVEKKKGFSVVEITPLTGRSNQIRIQFKQIGNPLLGERKYAFGRDFSVKFRRTALHAKSIGFAHPVTGERKILEAPMASDMQNFLQKY